MLINWRTHTFKEKKKIVRTIYKVNVKEKMSVSHSSQGSRSEK